MLLRRKTILWPAIPCCNLKIDIRLFLISGYDDATTRFQRAGMPTYKCPEQLLDHLTGGGEHRL
jgi:hypothetical protein